MRFVGVKTVEQQSIMMLHRVRSGSHVARHAADGRLRDEMTMA
jgi:hypothetical protein